MRWRKHLTRIVIVGSVLAVGGYLLVQERMGAPTTREIEGRKSNLLKVFRPDALTRIEVTRDGETYRLERTAPEKDAGDLARLWRVRSGTSDDLGDQAVIDKAMSALEFAYPQRSIKKEEVDRVAFGLDKPRLVVALTMGTVVTRISLGGEAARPEGSLYVDVDGAVSVIKREALNPIDLPADVFRTRKVMPYLSSEASRIEIKGEVADKVFVRDGALWRFPAEMEGGARVDRFAFDRLVGAFADLKAEHFLPEDQAKRVQEGKPLTTLALTPMESSSASATLTFGGECPDRPGDVVLLRDVPGKGPAGRPARIAVCVNRAVIDPLLAPSTAFVDRRPFSFREDEMEEIVLGTPDSRLEIIRKGNGWHQRAPIDADVPPELARALVKTLATAQAEEPGKAGELPSVRGTATINAAFAGDAGVPGEVVEIGPEKDGQVLLRRRYDGVLLRVPADLGASFLPRAISLRATKVINQPVDRIRSLTVKGAGTEQRLERSEAGVWKLATPPGHDVNLGLAAEMGEAAAHLAAERWVSDKDTGAFGLASARLSFSLVMAEEGSAQRTYEVRFGDSTAGGLFAQLTGDPAVFVAPRSVEQTLTQLAVDRSACVVHPSDVQSVTLKREGTSVTLVPSRELLKVADGGPELSSARLELSAALKDLRADAVVHLGPAARPEGLDKPQLEILVRRSDGKESKVLIGVADAHRGASVHYARCAGVDATFAIAAARVRPLLTVR